LLQTKKTPLVQPAFARLESSAAALHRPCVPAQATALSFPLSDTSAGAAAAEETAPARSSASPSLSARDLGLVLAVVGG